MSYRLSPRVIIFLIIMCFMRNETSTEAAQEKKVDGPQATINAACAPWDGSGFTIWIPVRDLSGKPNSWIEVSIWSEADSLEATFSFPDKTQEVGGATYYPDLRSRKSLNWSKAPHQELAGSLYLKKLNDQTPVLGEFDFVADNNFHMKGKFEAQWGNETAACG